MPYPPPHQEIRSFGRIDRCVGWHLPSQPNVVQTVGTIDSGNTAVKRCTHARGLRQIVFKGVESLEKPRI